MSVSRTLAKAGLPVALILAGGTLVAPWEGKENKAYQDPVGIWTQCYGNTYGVDRTRVKTDAECAGELAQQLVKHNEEMKRYVKVPLTIGQEAAFTSFVYNVGVGNWKSSTMLKLLNQGQPEQACYQLLRWNKAGGKVLKGLVSRRKDELAVCLGNNKQAELEAKRIFDLHKSGALYIGESLEIGNESSTETSR